MKKNYKKLPMQIYNGQFKHPFTCMIAGPTQVGKSTFVRELLLNKNHIIDTIFDYVIIVLGTQAKENTTLSSLKDEPIFKNKVEIIEIKQLFPGNELKQKFPEYLEDQINEKKGLPGIIIFDDCMYELSECHIIVDMFTKKSSHLNISIMFITQNMFYKGSGKTASDNVTVYRNTKKLVIFQNPLDNSIMSTIARRISSSRYKDMLKMLHYIVGKYRYVIIHGDFATPEQLRFSSDIFNTDPFPHQKYFQLT